MPNDNLSHSKTPQTLKKSSCNMPDSLTESSSCITSAAHTSFVLCFLTMDIDSAQTLCLKQCTHHHITWESHSSHARIYGSADNIKRFIAWLKGFFSHHVIFSDCLESIAIKRLKALSYTLAIAESCTGGLLSYRFTRIAGASSVFMGGIISYDNMIKQHLLHVSRESLTHVGAVSEEVVAQMLEGALQQCHASIALASSGVAGPSGASADKPIGLVFLGVQARGKPAIIKAHRFDASSHHHNLHDNALNDINAPTHAPMDYAQGILSYPLTLREYIQLQASTKALEMLLSYCALHCPTSA